MKTLEGYTKPRYCRDISGNIYGKLTAIEVVGRKNKHTYWTCRCECGETCIVAQVNLKTGSILSCGCSKYDTTTTHGYCKGKDVRSSEYFIWASMKDRCLNENNPNYKNYGGRGITLSAEWLRFENFIADMGLRPSKSHSIEREDNNAGYCKGNCKWIIRSEQNSNRRSNRKVIDTISGKIYRTIAEASRETIFSSGYLREMLIGKKPNKTTLKLYAQS